MSVQNGRKGCWMSRARIAFEGCIGILLLATSAWSILKSGAQLGDLITIPLGILLVWDTRRVARKLKAGEEALVPTE
jgi:hypothetical protein